MGNYKNFLMKYCSHGLVFIVATILLSCGIGLSSGPLSVHLSGNWEWQKTYNKSGKIIEEASSSLSKSLRFDGFVKGTNSGEVFRFYTNGIETDSLFMFDGPDNPTENKKNKTIYVDVVDATGINNVIRVTFFYTKGKSHPNRMEINIQRNTDIYIASADTIHMEYLSDNL